MNRIRDLRKQKKMTQKELAKYLQIADSTLSYWEMGRYEPDNEALMKLSRFFQVPIDYILGGDFIRWDISENRTSYPDVDIHLPCSDISVSEPEVAYNISNSNESFIEPTAIDSQSYIISESSIPNITKPVTPSKNTYGLRSPQAAFNRVEFEDLTQGEIDLLAEYAEFIKTRRKK